MSVQHIMLTNTIIPSPAGRVITSERLVCLSVVGSGPAVTTASVGGGGGTAI